MIIVPDSPPVISGLNSYYLVAERFLEHYQGELGSGAIHWLAPAAEAMIYFDPSGVFGGIYRDMEDQYCGGDVLERVVAANARHNFSVSVYAMDSAMVSFWFNLERAETLYQDLSSEFTDLASLIKKLQASGLTGFIEVAEPGGEVERLFFNFGKFVGGRYPGLSNVLDSSRSAITGLIARIRKTGAVFTVRRIPPDAPTPVVENPASALTSSGVIQILEDFLAISERTIQANRRTRNTFQTLLKQKFVQKADRYEFLDPFAADLDYREGKITFSGSASPRHLIEAVMACVAELAADLRLGNRLHEDLAPWRQRYADVLNGWQLTL